MVGALGAIVSRTELYTPWREDVERLQARTVGREAIVRRVVDEARRFAAGERVRPLYLFGPRGVGKSHIVALAAAEFETLGLTLVMVPEDVAATTTAAKLLDHCRPNADHWLSDNSGGSLAAPHILVVEGLDRRLADLGSGPEAREARQILRRHWTERPIWLIGTGVALTSTLTDREEPFYAHFDPEAIQPLSPEDARTLIDRSAPERARTHPRWSARRETLVTLAGGSPRVLVSLGEDCADESGPESASEALLAAVDRFTPHYQLRFRDLPPTGQEIVSLIARSPTMLTPTELAQKLGTHAASVGTQARRLADDGVIVGAPGPHGTPYHLAEPLFRFWLEYRTGRWEDTRVAVASHVLEALFTPDEIVDQWWEGTNDEVVDRAVLTGKSTAAAHSRLEEELNSLRSTRDQSHAQKLVQRAASLGKASVAAEAVEVFADGTATEVLRTLLPLMEALPIAHAIGQFVVELDDRVKPKTARAHLLPRLAAHEMDFITARVVTRVVLSALDRGSGPGKPWTLTADERRAAANVPFLRAAFLTRGRLSGHRPVLKPADLIPYVRAVSADIGELLVAAWGRPEAIALVDHVLTALEPGKGIWWRLRPCPKPSHSSASHANAITRWITRDLRRPVVFSGTLTWARALADADNELFDSFLAAVEANRELGAYGTGAALPALVAFTAASPDRMRRLLALAPPWLAPTARKAATLAAQTSAIGAGPLHPELAALRAALSAG